MSLAAEPPAIIFVDVGQGDCTIAVDRAQQVALIIDCPGGRSAYAEKVLRREGIQELEVAIVSHSDWDHMGGIVELLRRVPARDIYFNLDRRIPHDKVGAVRYLAFLREVAALEDAGLRTDAAIAPRTGAVGSIEWQILAPTHAGVGLALDDGETNFASAVVRLACNGTVALVSGDANSKSWGRALGSADVSADILRVPHHGGVMTAVPGGVSTSDLVDAVDASLAVVSVGSTNRYGHPAEETISALYSGGTRATRFMCTQLNAKCLAGTLTVDPSSLPFASRVGASGEGKGLPCAGSIEIALGEDGYSTSPTEAEHAAVVDQLTRTPLCRRDVVDDGETPT